MRHASNRVRAEFEGKDVFFVWKMFLYSDSLWSGNGFSFRVLCLFVFSVDVFGVGV
jgi:hypothetical protein